MDEFCCTLPSILKLPLIFSQLCVYLSTVCVCDDEGALVTRHVGVSSLSSCNMSAATNMQHQHELKNVSKQKKNQMFFIFNCHLSFMLLKKTRM